MSKISWLFFFWTLIASHVLSAAGDPVGAGGVKQGKDFKDSFHFLTITGTPDEVLTELKKLGPEASEMFVREAYKSPVVLEFEGTLRGTEDGYLVLFHVSQNYLSVFNEPSTRLQINLREEHDLLQCMGSQIGKRIKFALSPKQSGSLSTFNLSADSVHLFPAEYEGLSPLDIALLHKNVPMLQKLVPYILEDPSIFPATLGALLGRNRTVRTTEYGLGDISKDAAADRFGLEGLIACQKVELINLSASSEKPSFDLIKLMHELAKNLRLRGRFEEAGKVITKCQELLSVSEENFPFELGFSIQHLIALLEYNQGNLEKAEGLLRKSFKNLLNNVTEEGYFCARSSADTLIELLMYKKEYEVRKDSNFLNQLKNDERFEEEKVFEAQMKEKEEEALEAIGKIKSTINTTFEAYSDSEYVDPYKEPLFNDGLWQNRFELMLRLYVDGKGDDGKETVKLPNIFVHREIF